MLCWGKVTGDDGGGGDGDGGGDDYELGDGGGDDGLPVFMVLSVDPGPRSSQRDIEMHSLLADTEWVGGLAGLDPTPVLG